MNPEKGPQSSNIASVKNLILPGVLTVATLYTCNTLHKTRQALKEGVSEATANCEGLLSQAEAKATDLENALVVSPEEVNCVTGTEKLVYAGYILGQADATCDQPIVKNPPRDARISNSFTLIFQAQDRFKDLCLRAQGLRPREIRREKANSGN